MLLTVDALERTEGYPKTLELRGGKGEWTIGRDKACDICLDSQRVSRQHAKLFRNASNGFSIADLGSKAGISVNGARVDGAIELQPGGMPVVISGFSLLLSAKAGSMPLEHQASPPSQPLGIPEEFGSISILYTNDLMLLKKRIHGIVLEKLNLADLTQKDIEGEEMRFKLEAALDLTLKEQRHELPRSIPLELLRQSLLDELTGYGPISPLLRMEGVDEIMANGPDLIFVERNGRISETGARFFNNQHMMTIIQRIVEPLGRHIDEASPMVDARLPDGSRVNAIIHPLSLDGPSLTIRKFSKKKLTTEDLIRFGSMTPEIALFLQEAVRSRQNILVSGGTGSGKTTLLNVLSQFIGLEERVVTIEDSAELKLSHRDVVRLEARPANIEGKGRISIRDLVINALRMRPDRIVVGECRGPEALDMLQAMNTGHDGSLTTCHANNPRDALGRLENMVMMAGYDLPSSAIREQIASAINLVVQQSRMQDGSRKIVQISEITGREGNMVLLQDIFSYQQSGVDKNGRIEGHYVATGNIPHFVEELRERGALRLEMAVFVPQS